MDDPIPSVMENGDDAGENLGDWALTRRIAQTENKLDAFSTSSWDSRIQDIHRKQSSWARAISDGARPPPQEQATAMQARQQDRMTIQLEIEPHEIQTAEFPSNHEVALRAPGHYKASMSSEQDTTPTANGHYTPSESVSQRRGLTEATAVADSEAPPACTVYSGEDRQVPADTAATALAFLSSSSLQSMFSVPRTASSRSETVDATGHDASASAPCPSGSMNHRPAGAGTRAPPMEAPRNAGPNTSSAAWTTLARGSDSISLTAPSVRVSEPLATTDDVSRLASSGAMAATGSVAGHASHDASHSQRGELDLEVRVGEEKEKMGTGPRRRPGTGVLEGGRGLEGALVDPWEEHWARRPYVVSRILKSLCGDASCPMCECRRRHALCIA